MWFQLQQHKFTFLSKLDKKVFTWEDLQWRDEVKWCESFQLDVLRERERLSFLLAQQSRLFLKRNRRYRVYWSCRLSSVLRVNKFPPCLWPKGACGLLGAALSKCGPSAGEPVRHPVVPQGDQEWIVHHTWQENKAYSLRESGDRYRYLRHVVPELVFPYRKALDDSQANEGYFPSLALSFLPQ